MRKILQKLFAELFILSQYFYFLFMLFCPFFYIFSYLVNSFFRQKIFIIGFFFFCGLGLINELVNELKFPVNEFFQYKSKQEKTSAEYQCKNYESSFPVIIIKINDQADWNCQYDSSDERKF